MINRQSHAFSYNSGNNCTQKHVITYTNRYTDNVSILLIIMFIMTEHVYI